MVNLMKSFNEMHQISCEIKSFGDFLVKFTRFVTVSSETAKRRGGNVYCISSAGSFRNALYVYVYEIETSVKEQKMFWALSSSLC